MLVLATSSQGHFHLGKLRVMHLPSAEDLVEADNKKAQGMARPQKVPQPTVKLDCYEHQAHTQQILATARQVGPPACERSVPLVRLVPST
jgi:hypothetical protein